MAFNPEAGLPSKNRVDLKGNPICRWCSTRLESNVYISLRSKRRAEQWSCPKCDVGKISWREEFYPREDDGA